MNPLPIMEIGFRYLLAIGSLVVGWKAIDTWEKIHRQTLDDGPPPPTDPQYHQFHDTKGGLFVYDPKSKSIFRYFMQKDENGKLVSEGWIKTEFMVHIEPSLPE